MRLSFLFRQTEAIISPLRVGLGRIGSLFRASTPWQPLKLRGLILLSLSLYALLAIALEEMDLVAAALSGSVIALLLLSVVFFFYLRLKLTRVIGAQCFFAHDHLSSKRAIPAGIKLTNCSLPPCSLLKIERIFDSPGVASPVHLLKGQASPGEVRHLIDEIFFANRGLWTLESLKFSIGDALGLVSYSWLTTIGQSLEIAPPRISISPLAIPASSARAGDELNLSNTRSGDPFDIKQYDPSDGTKRILWKTYAKSRNLVVRRPETAVVPEGELALFLVAKTEEDHVAAAALDYLSLLNDKFITVLFGTDDSESADADLLSKESGFSKEPGEILTRIIRAANSKHAGSAKGLSLYLESLSSSGHFLHSVVVLASESQIEKDPSLLNTIEKSCKSYNVKPILALVPDDIPERYAWPKLEIDKFPGTAWISAEIIFSKLSAQLSKHFASFRQNSTAGLSSSSAGLETIRIETRE